VKKLLTVDDSRAVRSMVTKAVREAGYEVDEAEDGEQGLARLEEAQYDLILLDVTMPVLDGPGMLERMRARGDKTPVLMLTSESKRSIVANVMQSGISDYILKPFKPEDLAAKINKVLGDPGGGANVATAPTASASSPGASSSSSGGGGGAAGARSIGGRAFIDVLVVDDMENVHKKVRTILPQHISMAGVNSARAAVQAAQDKVFRVMMIDIDLPDVAAASLVSQLRSLQPHSGVIALGLRGSDAKERSVADGFDGVLHKPFDQAELDEVIQQYFDNQELVVRDDNVLSVAAFVGKDDRQERYFERVLGLVTKELDDIAAACFEEVVVDVSKAPLRPDRLPKFIGAIASSAVGLGLELRLVAGPDMRKLLSSFADTHAVQAFSAVSEARA
jgi:DNA-binding response OmpR family regulator